MGVETINNKQYLIDISTDPVLYSGLINNAISYYLPAHNNVSYKLCIIGEDLSADIKIHKFQEKLCVVKYENRGVHQAPPLIIIQGEPYYILQNLDSSNNNVYDDRVSALRNFIITLMSESFKGKK